MDLVRPDDLSGVEVLVAERSVRRWVVLHHTYTVCTVKAIGRPVPWRYRGRVFELGADGVSFYEPGEVHANLEVSTPATFRVLLIDPLLVENAAADLAVRGPVHFGLSQVNGETHPELRRAFLGLHGSLEQVATTLERESRFTGCLRLLLEQCAEVPARLPAQGRRSDASSVRRAQEFIEEHLCAPVRLREVVEASGAASPFQLLRSFSSAVGLPPHAYQVQRRVIRSRQLLAFGVPPAEVAVEMGFFDQAHFTRHFSRVVGVTPGAYARAVRGS